MRPQFGQTLSVFAPIPATRGRILLRCCLIACCLASVLLLASPQNGFGFSLNGYRWPSGSQIGMSLGLNRPPVPLQDGSASWNASAADALAVWNQYVDTVKFNEAAAVSPSGGDGANSVFFSNTIYGQAFGSTTLAVTINYSNLGSGVFTETDVIFNNAITWNSYRGPIQGSGATATYDFHRVALHEFGHVLGLDHPDQHGQNVIALMNSIITDLDHLADDDIAGGRSLYGFKVTSSLNPSPGRSGDNFAYQITANNNPTTFSATGLPSGLQLDAGTGLISGRCSTSGGFQVDVVAQGTLGIATGRVQILIFPLPIYSTSYIQFQAGDKVSYQILAANNPTSYGATSLPAWLHVDSANGLISGVAQVAGTFDIRVTANSAASEAAGNVRIVVMPPRITSALSIPATELGDNLAYQITATNNPSSFAVTGLPSGLQINSETGLINGTSTVSGTFYVSLTAQTDYGPASATLQIQILPPRFTSNLSPGAIEIGSDFSYQLVASHHPTSFSATGLPAGFQIDPVTGRITGVPSLSGTYQITVRAQTSLGEISSQLVLVVRNSGTPEPTLAVFKINPDSMLADPNRSRVYAQVTNQIFVIDTNSLSVISTKLAAERISDMSISADGSKLWIAHGSVRKSLSSLDLNTLAFLPELPLPFFVDRIREGLGQRLYVTDTTGNGFQLDAATGAQQLSFWTSRYRSVMQISPDRKTLYIGDTYAGPATLARFDISTPTPSLLQKTNLLGGTAWALSLNHSGTLLCYATTSGDAMQKGTYLVSAQDLEKIHGNLPPPPTYFAISFSADDSVAYRLYSNQSLDVFDVTSLKKVRSIYLAADAYNYGMPLVDASNRYLFVATLSGIKVFSTRLVQPPSPAHSLLNVATRLQTKTGENVLIGGFIISGDKAKKILARAVGPSLPLSGKLNDPVLELHDATGALVAENDNWNSRRAEVLASGAPPNDEHESAIVSSLQPGSYTAILHGVNNTTGVALVELYDLEPENSRIANISTRGKVEVGDNVMIGGFILGGDQVTNVAVRAIGPSLTKFEIADVLDDPTLAVHDGNGALLAQDDDWRMYQEQMLIDSGLAPSDNRESAMLLWLQPGAYTAIVRGKDDSVGVGLVEVYNLDAK
jgi:hypothetical protein